jgi:hypothetical protein
VLHNFAPAHDLEILRIVSGGSSTGATECRWALCISSVQQAVQSWPCTIWAARVRRFSFYIATGTIVMSMMTGNL